MHACVVCVVCVCVCACVRDVYLITDKKHTSFFYAHRKNTRNKGLETAAMCHTLLRVVIVNANRKNQQTSWPDHAKKFVKRGGRRLSRCKHGGSVADVAAGLRR